MTEDNGNKGGRIDLKDISGKRMDLLPLLPHHSLQFPWLPLCFSHIRHTLFFFLIEVQLSYNVVLVSDVQQSDSYIYFFIFFSIIGYYRILNIVPCAIQ